MKRHLKLTVFAVALFALVALLCLTAFAATDGATTEEADHNFKVTDKDGANAKYYVDIVAAYAAIPDGGTMYLLNDYTYTASSGKLVVTNANGSVTIDGGGLYTLSFFHFKVKTTATKPTVTVQNLKVVGTDTYYAFNTNSGALTLQFKNCNITSAGSIVHMNVANSTVKFLGTDNVCTINNEKVSNRYMVVLQANTAGHSVVVEGGTFTANGAKNPGFIHMNTAEDVTLTVSGGSFSLLGGMIYNGGTGTVTASFASCEVTMTAANHMFRSATASGESWSLTFNSGTFTPYAAKNVISLNGTGSSATVTVNAGATFNLKDSSAFSYVNTENGTLTVNGGVFNVAGNTSIFLGAHRPTVSGGEFVVSAGSVVPNKAREQVDFSKAKLTAKGAVLFTLTNAGEYTVSTQAELLEMLKSAAGYGSYDLASAWHGVTLNNEALALKLANEAATAQNELAFVSVKAGTLLYVAIDGDTLQNPAHKFKVVDAAGDNARYYVNLVGESGALANLPAGGTIYLLDDFSTSGVLEINTANALTIDGNGYTVSVKFISIAGQGNITFKNLTVKGTDVYHLFIVRTASTLSFSGATLQSAGSIVHMDVSNISVAFLGTENKITVTSSKQENRFIVNAQAGTSGHTVTVEGGSFTAGGELATGFLYVDAGASVTLNAVGGKVVAPMLVYNGGSLTATLALDYSGAVGDIFCGSGGESAWKLTFTGGRYVGDLAYTVLNHKAGSLSLAVSDAAFINVFTFASFASSVTATFTRADIATKNVCLIVPANSKITLTDSTIVARDSSVMRADGYISLTVKGGVYAGSTTMPTFYMYPKSSTGTNKTISIDGIEAYGDALLNIRGGAWSSVKVANSTLCRNMLSEELAADSFIEIDSGSIANNISSLIVQGCRATLEKSILFVKAGTVKFDLRDGCYFESTGMFLDAVPSATVTLTVRGGYYYVEGDVFSLGNGSVTVNGGKFRIFGVPFLNSAVSAVLNGGVFILDVADQTDEFLPADASVKNLTVLSDRVIVIDREAMAFDSSVIYYGGKPYYIYTTAAASNSRYDPTTVDEAKGSVYLGDDLSKSGVRFVTVLSDAMIANAATQKKNGKTVKYGTIIAPMDYVAAAGEFTVEALDALNISAVKYEKIEAVRSVRTNADGDVIAYSAALVNLKTKNYNRMFAAISYVEIGGTIYYGEFNEKDNVRSASEIATVLLSVDAPEYSGEELAVLNAYAAAYEKAPYVLVLDDALSTYTARKAQGLYDTLGSVMAARVPVVVDSFALDISATEILVGKTDRAESSAVLATLGDYGYAITKKNDKIVIVGTTDVLTAMALDLFVSTYLEGKSNLSTLSVTNTTKTGVAMMELTSSFNYVYQNGLDAVINYYGNKVENGVVGVRGEGNKNYNYDYPVLAATMLRDRYCALMGIESTAVLAVSDSTTVANEVLVGKTSRTAMTSFVKGFDVDNYGISITGGKILIGALTDNALKCAVERFAELMAAGFADGKILLPASYTDLGVMPHDWVTDFPRPATANVSLTSSIPVGENSLLFVYTGSGINSTALSTYCSKLVSSGYTLYMENTIGTSVFRTYVNYAKNHTLHIIYSLYEFAAINKITTYEPSIRIVSASLDDVNLPDKAMLTQDLSYEKVIDSRLTVMRLNWMPGCYENGNSTPDKNGDGEADELSDPERGYGNPYIVTLEDGSFVVVDGGFTNSADMKRLYDLLNALHKEATGADATAENPIRIAAWLLTHDHSDHYQLFFEFLRNRLYTDTVVLERLIANFTSEEEIFNAVDPGVAIRNYADSLNKLLGGNCQYIKVHTGQKFHIANATFEVLGTHEDVYPARIARFNDTSTVVRVTLDHTNGSGKITSGSSESILFLGDAEVKQSNSMNAMLGTYLESDIVQMSHHAGGGANLTLYKYALTTIAGKNKVVLVPQSRVYYYAHINDTNKVQKATGWGCTYAVTNVLASVKYVFINDDYNTTFVLGATGFNYEMRSSTNLGGFYNLYDNTAMVWSTNPYAPKTSIIKK